MLKLFIALYMLTGWAGAIKVHKIAKREREEERFMSLVNRTIERMRDETFVWLREEIISMVPSNSLPECLKVELFLENNDIICWTGSRYELTEKFK